MNPSYEILFALVSVLEMSFDSLFASEEDRETEDIRELVVLYNACPEKGRHLIVEAVRTLSKELSNIFQEQSSFP